MVGMQRYINHGPCLGLSKFSKGRLNKATVRKRKNSMLLPNPSKSISHPHVITPDATAEEGTLRDKQVWD